MKKLYKALNMMLLGIMLSVMGACSLTNSLEEQANKDEDTIKKYLEQNNLTGRAKRYANGMYQVIDREGTGAVVSPTDAVQARYTLYLLNGVKVVTDTSYIFQPAVGAFILGIAQAASVMRIGEKSQFLLPSSLAFGQSSGELNGVTIAAYSVLRLELEVVAARNSTAQLDYEEGLLKSYIAQNKWQATRDPSGIYYVVVKAGTGSALPATTVVTVNYVGKFLDNTIFDKGNDVTFSIGTGQLIQGWNIGIPLMKKEEKGILLIPSQYGYGASGSSGKIAPYTPLVFEIEVLK